MYQAIVFLPLVGAILAGLITLAGARARYPGGSPRGLRGTIMARMSTPRTITLPHAWRDTTAHHPTEPAAAGSRAAELITTSLLFISMILSWIAFVSVGFGQDVHVTPDQLVHRRRPQGRLGAARRHADRGDAGGGDHDLRLRASLFDRLHGGGAVPAALLLLPVAVHLRHADAGDLRQPGAAVLRLGGRRPDELSAHRLLVPEAGGERGRDQGLHRQPRRRFRLRARHLRRVHDDRRGRLRHHLRAGAVAHRQDHPFPRSGTSTR